MKQIHDTSLFAAGNLSVIDAGSDIEGATTLALNRTKSNDKMSAYTKKTLKDGNENLKTKLEKGFTRIEQQKKEANWSGLKNWYKNNSQFNRGDFE